MINIKPDHLLIYVNDVNKNCKKAVCICQLANSPYKGHHSTGGGFPSGTNCIDYINWICKEMDQLLVDKDQQRLLNLLDEEDIPQQEYDDLNVEDDEEQEDEEEVGLEEKVDNK